MKRVCVIGHFGLGEELLNGQTIKTKIVTKELERQLGKKQVMKIDTHGGIKALVRLPFQVLSALKNCKNVIILPAHNGLRIITPLLLIENKLFRCQLHYVVIGGWLPSFVESKKILRRQLKQFNHIYVETSTMKKALQKQGFKNIVIMPNCKELHILDESELVYNSSEPFKLCTFSRVMKEKGIEDAVNAVKAVNEKLGRVVYELDIYGQVDSEQVEWFDELKKEFPEFVHYKGLVPFDKTVEVIKNYYLLLFPTRFFTEGIPGTIIDAYAAGVPVVASKWESYSDIINRSCGIVYPWNDNTAFQKVLEKLLYDKEIVFSLKSNVIKQANRYLPPSALEQLIQRVQ